MNTEIWRRPSYLAAVCGDAQMPFTAWITPFVLSRCVKWTTHRAASLTQFSPLAVKLVQDAELRCGELLHLCRVNLPGLCFSGFSEWQFVFSLQQLMSRFLPITGASFSLHTAWPHNFLVITGFSWAGEQSYRGIAMVRKNRVWKMLLLLLCTRNVALPGMPFALAVPPLVRSKRGVAMWLCGTWAAQDDGQKGKGRKGIKKGLKERSYFAFWISPDQLFEKCCPAGIREQSSSKANESTYDPTITSLFVCPGQLVSITVTCS